MTTTGLTYPHIEKTDGQPARLQRVPRVRVAQIAMDYIAHGWSADEMCRQHTYLNPSEVHAALGYYFDHQDEIDEEIRQESAEYEALMKQKPRSAFFLRMRSTRS
ncbi:MAG TPA: DUF433 domain-containing protein [Tepidisphaeraceae bacterium]|jgi:uncharacterized protein (DUF433 family)|nr:DUF433 domain-containing protein [Tepidisphaeraceae bacterium]